MNMFFLWMGISSLLIVVGFIVCIRGLCRYWSETMTILGILIMIFGLLGLLYTMHDRNNELREQRNEEVRAFVEAAEESHRTRLEEYNRAIESGYSVYINGAQVDPDDIDPDKYVDYMTFNDELKKIYITFI